MVLLVLLISLFKNMCSLPPQNYFSIQKLKDWKPSFLSFRANQGKDKKKREKGRRKWEKVKIFFLKTLVNNKVTKTSFFDLHTMVFCILYNKGEFSSIFLQLRKQKLITFHSVLHWKEMYVTLLNVSHVEFGNLSFLCGIMSFHGSPQNAAL